MENRSAGSQSRTGSRTGPGAWSGTWSGTGSVDGTDFSIMFPQWRQLREKES